MEFQSFNSSGISEELTKAFNELGKLFERRQVFQADGSAGVILICEDVCEKEAILKYILNEDEELDEVIWEKTTRGRGANANAYIKDAKAGIVKIEVKSNYGGRAKLEVKEVYAISKFI